MVQPAMQCVCATVGYHHPVWNNDYYPEECPEEWRFAYYMNDFRAVFLPQDQWCGHTDQVEEISEELDEGFDLVLEWPRLDQSKRSRLWLARLAPLVGNVACIVVNAPAKGGFDQRQLNTLTLIAEKYAVNIAADREVSAELMAQVEALELGIVWRPGQAMQGQTKTAYQVVRLPCLELREMKLLLEKLRPVLDKNTRCGLFIDPAPQSAGRAIQTRTLIELMGLA